MNRRSLVLLVVLAMGVLTLAGCARESSVDLSEPTKVTPIEGTSLNQITLTEVAYNNLGAKTEPVRQESQVASGSVTGKRRLIISADALIFDPKGDPYAYTSPAPRTYVRAPLVINEYRGNDVYLTSGPPVGTQVVTIGDPELLGIEYGVGEE